MRASSLRLPGLCTCVPEITAWYFLLPICTITGTGEGRKPPPAATNDRSAVETPLTPFSSVVAVAFWKFTRYSRAMPRLLPHAPPPALAEGWLVLNSVVPATVVDEPTVFSPAASVTFQPREACNCACARAAWELLHTVVSCRQLLVASNRPLGAVTASKVVSVTVAWPVASSPVLRSLNM